MLGGRDYDVDASSEHRAWQPILNSSLPTSISAASTLLSLHSLRSRLRCSTEQSAHLKMHRLSRKAWLHDTSRKSRKRGFHKSG